MGFWLFLLLRLGLLTLAGLVSYWLLGPLQALVVVCGVLLLGHAYQNWQLLRLRRWLKATDASRLPEETGLWGDIFVDLYRAQKQQAADRDQLIAALERFREATSALPEGVLMLDRDGRIEWFNACARTQFGLDAGRDVGTLATHLIRQPEFAGYLLSRDTSDPLQLRIGSGNQGRDLSVLLVPFAGGRLLYSRDVTQLKRVETMRRDFIANVSHELRTPLTVILGFLDPLREDGEMPPETRGRFLEMIKDQALRMNRLVEDLLTLSRLEAQQEPQREETVDVPTLLADLMEEGRALSGGRHRFETDITGGSLRGCPQELRSAFGNLISNAVRYTPEGGLIRVRWGREGYQPLFEVSDSGIGIAADHIPRLTERFYRVDKGRSADTGGTGLGLSIVKHVLLHHQARLDIVSTPGQGSRFRVLFPTERGPAGEVSPARPGEPV